MLTTISSLTLLTNLTCLMRIRLIRIKWILDKMFFYWYEQFSLISISSLISSSSILILAFFSSLTRSFSIFVLAFSRSRSLISSFSILIFAFFFFLTRSFSIFVLVFSRSLISSFSILILVLFSLSTFFSFYLWAFFFLILISCVRNRSRFVLWAR